ncbi:MAG: hypothetical protein ACXABY_12550, partial [Candidatus Thorarchaeota archaeon]
MYVDAWVKHRVMTGAVYRSFFKQLEKLLDNCTEDNKINASAFTESTVMLIDLTKDFLNDPELMEI